MSSPAADLIVSLIASTRALNPGRAPLIGVAGAQGCGKTTLCRAIAAASSGRIAHFSLDDVYLTRAEREALAQSVHPLFVTRGPPGTHDLALARRTIGDLRAGKPVRLPRFDKARDDRAPEADWPAFTGPAEAILFDGWCLGALAPEDTPPLNDVEREDANGVWRGAIRNALAGRYADFFAAFDDIVLLRAPSFDIVRTWRAQQEEETLGRPLTPADHARLDRFIQHYERITRAMLAGRHMARHVVQLDEMRRVVRGA